MKATGEFPRSGPRPSGTLDDREVDRFGKQAAAWWDPEGNFRPLHQLGPARMAFIRDQACRHFARSASGLRPLTGLSAIDVGCGGGLVSEPLARLGAAVTGVDPSPENIAVASAHARAQDLQIDYRSARVEDLAAAGARFDLVICLEVIEHVPDVPAFVALLARVLQPGGLMVLSTINRTLKAYALAILGAEYVLRWLPAGTHQWDRFVTPGELARHLEGAGLTSGATRGLVYRPLADEWVLGSDTDVNYMVAAAARTGNLV